MAPLYSEVSVMAQATLSKRQTKFPSSNRSTAAFHEDTLRAATLRGPLEPDNPSS
jgi:hypothetical protein